MVNISSADDLYKLMNGELSLSGNYTVTANIDITGYTSKSIGGTFTGTFDGGDYNIIIGDIVSNYIGFFSTISGTVSNCNIIYNRSTNITGSIVGGFVAFNRPGNISNCNVIFASNINITGSSNAGGFVGQNNNGTISTGISNCNVIFLSTVNITGLDSASNVGGFIGRNGTLNNNIISNCNAIFNDDTNINGILNTGGFAGYQGVNDIILNCNVIFGDNVVINANTRAGGFIGLNSTTGGTSNISNCNAVFGTNYKINATNAGAFAGALGNVTAIYTLTYGTPNSESDVQNILGPGNDPGYINQTNIFNNFNNNVNNIWLEFLIRFREHINNNGDRISDPAEIALLNIQYFNDIFNQSPNVYKLPKNYAIQSSMSYNNTEKIILPYSNIKTRLLINSSDTLEGTALINYLNYSNIYNLLYDNIYYILPDAILNVEDKSFIFTTNVNDGFIVIDNTNISIDLNINKNSVKFTNYGVGSGLLGVERGTPEPPTPTPEPGTKSEGLSWWWWILIVLGILLVLILVYYFYKDLLKKNIVSEWNYKNKV